MATSEPSKQTNVRLPLRYHEQLQQMAEQQGKPVGTFARELVIAALSGGGSGGSSLNGSHLDTNLLMERLDSIEDSITEVSNTHHIALRAILKALLEDPIEAHSMSKLLDAILGPVPPANRT